MCSRYGLVLGELGLSAGLLCYSCGNAFAQPRTVSHHRQSKIIPRDEILVSSGEDFAHVETMLAADPADSKHLLASCIALPRGKNNQFQRRARTYVSRDGGRTWKASRPLPDEDMSDPIVAFSPHGTALLVVLASKKLSLFRSEDGGGTWGSRTDLPAIDYPKVAADQTHAEHRRWLYITGKMGDDSKSPIMLYRSLDDGRTFETSIVFKDPNAGQSLHPIVLSDGTLFVPFKTQIGRGPGYREKFDCVRSSDAGQTFSEPFPLMTSQPNMKGRYADSFYPAFAKGSHAGNERLFALVPVYRGDANARLTLRHSDDGGQTWTEGKDIVAGVDEEVTQSAANVMVNRYGVVGMSWLERKIGPMNSNDQECERLVCYDETYDLFFTASLDGGDTFLAPTKITTSPSTPRPKHASRFWPGFDYMLADVARDGTFHLLWPDARSGIFQLYTSAVRVK